ncbi:MAG: hypothetical protein ACJAUD_001270 [Crocinitomicaceae bacterium]|jgi:hypothetical protein
MKVMLNKSKVISIGLGVTVMAGALFSFTNGERNEKKKMYHVIHQHDGELKEYDTVLPMSSAYSVENFLADKGIENENVEIIKVPSMDDHFMRNGEGEEGRHFLIKEMNRTMVIDGEGESENVMIQVEIDDKGNKVIKKTVNGVEMEMTEEEHDKMESESDRLHKGRQGQRIVIDHIDDSDMNEEEKAELMEKLKNEMHDRIIKLDSLGEGMEIHFETLIEEIHELENESGDVQIMIRKMDGAESEIEWISDGQNEPDNYRMRMIHSEEEDFTLVIVTENLSNESNEAAHVKREMAQENEMVVFPNPNNGIFTIQFDQQEKRKTKIEIVDAQGKLVFEESLGKFSGQYKKEIDLKNRGTGIYIIKIQQGKKMVSNKVIVD